jgi:hypothetical protein
LTENIKYSETGEELILIDPQAVKWGTIPCTSGMEIEQQDTDIRQCSKIREDYRWSYDPSGPIETSLPPSIAPYKEIKNFISKVIEERCIWEWKGFYTRWSSEIGCGSHIHLRPRPSQKQKEEWPDMPGIDKDPEYPHPDTVTLEEVWATAYNTLVEVVPWIIPLFCAGGQDVMRCRESATHWGELRPERKSPEAMRSYLRESYTGHPYHAVALDRKTTQHVLTIELRLNENHPAIAYTTIVILNRIIRRVYERGYVSPKLAVPNRERLYSKLNDAIYKSASYYEDLYTYLDDAVREYVEEYGPIRFVEGREIPRLRKKEFTSYFELFHEIIYNYTDWRNPPEYRVYKLYAAKGNPRNNWKQLWYLMHTPAGQFCWEEPNICGL